jgi:hypothetical protein
MAKIFEFNAIANGDKCPICNTKAMKDACLVPIAGTQNGPNITAIQVHIDCLIDKSSYLSNVDLIMTPCFDYKDD